MTCTDIQICNVTPNPGEIDIVFADGIDERIARYTTLSKNFQFSFFKKCYTHEK